MQGLEAAWDEQLAEERPLTYNLAPSALSWVIREKEERPVPSLLKWGFKLEEGQTGRPPPINARIETASTKWPFKFAWNDSRCAVPADGWYEWRAEADGKQPFYFTRYDEHPIYFAGIWSASTFCMFTTEADGELTAVHHRKPIALSPERAIQWINGTVTTAEDLVALAMKAPDLKVYPVSRAVSNWRNNGPELINPL